MVAAWPPRRPWPSNTPMAAAAGSPAPPAAASSSLLLLLEVPCLEAVGCTRKMSWLSGFQRPLARPPAGRWGSRCGQRMGRSGGQRLGPHQYSPQLPALPATAASKPQLPTRTCRDCGNVGHAVQAHAGGGVKAAGLERGIAVPQLQVVAGLACRHAAAHGAAGRAGQTAFSARSTRAFGAGGKRGTPAASTVAAAQAQRDPGRVPGPRHPLPAPSRAATRLT